MVELIRELAQCLAGKQLAGRPIVLAYSGGVDSQVLLHLLSKWQQSNSDRPMLAVHVNHGLSDNALDWQHFADSQCQKLAVDFQSVKVDLSDANNRNLEANARQMRYQAIEHLAADNSIILTGHHLDDQAETVLLALKRGSGTLGLSAMQVINSFPLPSEKKLHVVRPLLGTTRQQIEAYANAKQLTWINDESNTDERFDRNFIRHQILPILQQRWPAILTTINRSAELCHDSNLVIHEIAEQDLAKCSQNKQSLAVEELLQLSNSRLNNVVRQFLANQQIPMPSVAQLEQIKSQLLHTSDDKQPTIQLQSIWLRRFKQHIYSCRSYKDVSDWTADLSLLTTEPIQLDLPDNIGTVNFTYNAQNQENLARLKLPTDAHISIVFSHNNPQVLPDYRHKQRPLKKVLQELNVPPWLRARIPFIYYKNELVAAVGLFVCKQFLATENESGFSLNYQLVEQMRIR